MRQRWNVLSVRMKCYMILDHSAAAGIGCPASHMKKIILIATVMVIIQEVV